MISTNILETQFIVPSVVLRLLRSWNLLFAENVERFGQRELFCFATVLPNMAQETIETIRELKLERLLKLFENRNLGDCWNDTKTEVVAFP